MRIALVIERMDTFGGGRERSVAEIATELSRRGHEVSVLCQMGSLPESSVRVLSLGRIGLTRSAQMANFIRMVEAEIRGGKYDIVHIVCGRLAAYVKCMGNVPSVIDWIDALSMSTERMYLSEKTWIKKMLYFFEWKKMKRYEERNSDICDFSFITSQVDNDYLENKIEEVIPNGVDMELFILKVIKYVFLAMGIFGIVLLIMASIDWKVLKENLLTEVDFCTSEK